MGKKYERYEEAKQNLDQARKDLAVAQGGSTQEQMQYSKVKLGLSQQAEASAWNEFIADPEG